MTTAASAALPLTARDWIAPYHLPAPSIFDASRFESLSLDLDLSAAFDVSPDDRLFILGSCFARDAMHGLLKRAQQRMNRDVPPLSGTALGHKYSAFSINQGLDFVDRMAFDERLIVELTDGTFFDGHRHPVISHPSREQAHEQHLAALEQTHCELQAVDVISLTLDTIEVWHDDEFDAPLNTPPPIDRIEKFHDRFRFRRTTYAENQAAIVNIFRRLDAIAPGVRILAAVSPIPMFATFTGEDILVANTYCKSVLRAALTEAIEIAKSHAINVRYCPTYELVANQPRRDDVWRTTDPAGHPDGRHLDESFAHSLVARALQAPKRTL